MCGCVCVLENNSVSQKEIKRYWRKILRNKASVQLVVRKQNGKFCGQKEEQKRQVVVHRVHSSSTKTCIALDFWCGELQDLSQEWVERTKDCDFCQENEDKRQKINSLRTILQLSLPRKFLDTLFFLAGEIEAHRFISASGLTID